MLVRDNRRAFFTDWDWRRADRLVGVTLPRCKRALPPFAFMPTGRSVSALHRRHVTIFERLIAMTRDRGNIGYLMYLADSFGYLGYVGVLFARNWFGPAESFLSYFVTLNWMIVGASVVLLVPCWRYFAAHSGTRQTANLERSEFLEAETAKGP